MRVLKFFRLTSLCLSVVLKGFFFCMCMCIMRDLLLGLLFVFTAVIFLVCCLFSCINHYVLRILDCKDFMFLFLYMYMVAGSWFLEFLFMFIALIFSRLVDVLVYIIYIWWGFLIENVLVLYLLCYIVVTV